MIAQDWVNDLVEFGPDIVSVACGDWRIAQSKRPTIADIRKLCIAEQVQRRGREPEAALPPQSAERLSAAREADMRMQTARYEEARIARDRMARELGFADFGAWMAFGLVAGWNRGASGNADLNAVRENLGVTAREFKPSADRLAKDRAALGIESPAAGEDDATI